MRFAILFLTLIGFLPLVALADEADQQALYEGWNQLEWQYDSVSGPALGRALDHAVGPERWDAVACFRGEWAAYYREAPLPGFNTLDQLEPGDSCWVFTAGEASYHPVGNPTLEVVADFQCSDGVPQDLVVSVTNNGNKAIDLHGVTVVVDRLIDGEKPQGSVFFIEPLAPEYDPLPPKETATLTGLISTLPGEEPLDYSADDIIVEVEVVGEADGQPLEEPLSVTFDSYPGCPDLDDAGT